MAFLFDKVFFFWVRCPLTREYYTNSQLHSRETNACDGCMFLAPPTHNNLLIGPTSETERQETKLEKLNRRKVFTYLELALLPEVWQTSIRCKMCRPPPSSIISTGTDPNRTLSVCAILLTGSQQTSPTASTSHTSLPQPTISAAFSAIEAKQRQNQLSYAPHR